MAAVDASAVLLLLLVTAAGRQAGRQTDMQAGRQSVSQTGRKDRDTHKESHLTSVRFANRMVVVQHRVMLGCVLPAILRVVGWVVG